MNESCQSFPSIKYLVWSILPKGAPPYLKYTLLVTDSMGFQHLDYVTTWCKCCFRSLPATWKKYILKTFIWPHKMKQGCFPTFCRPAWSLFALTTYFTRLQGLHLHVSLLNCMNFITQSLIYLFTAANYGIDYGYEPCTGLLALVQPQVSVL